LDPRCTFEQDEIVEVALPQSDQNTALFAGRVFSIRIRAKHIR
jgi:hypothetical protein